MKRGAFILVMVLALAAFGTAQAQVPSFGLKGGLTFAKLKGDNLDDFAKNKTGFMIGGFAAIPLGTSLAVQPEIFYVQKGSKLEDSGMEGEIKYDVIEIPVLLKYTVAGEGFNPYFVFGPSLAFKASAKEVFDGVTEDLDDVKSSDFSLVFGLGANISKFLVEARYTVGMTDLNDSSDPVDQGSAKSSTIALLAGLTF